MAALRLAIILVLSVTGACAPSSLIEAMGVVEASEEEVYHRSGGRQSLRPIRAALPPPSPVRQIQAASGQPPVRVSGAAARRPTTEAPPRRTPSAVSDSPPASDDPLA